MPEAPDVPPSVKRLLAEIWLTQEQPDYGGPRWFELYRGSAIDETFVCVDFNCNVLHVRREGRAQLTLSYLPGWCYQALTRLVDPSRLLEISTAFVNDFELALPLRFELDVVHEVAAAAGTFRPTTMDGAPGAVSYLRLPFGYEFEPGHAFALEEGKTGPLGSALQALGNALAPAVEQVHWSAMKLRVVVAPGVSFLAKPLLDEATLATARRAYLPSIGGGPSCSQALQFELERRQDPHTLPGLGARFRSTPLAEPDLVAGHTTAREGCALALELTRPDGVDILLMRPGHGESFAPWLLQVVETLGEEILDWFVDAMGGVPPFAPLQIRIRVDPGSAEDRFAYRIRYLNTSGEAVDGPTTDTDSERPCFRLAVIRTPGVRVFYDSAVASRGEEELRHIVEYHEEEVACFEEVPLFLDDGNEPVRGGQALAARKATAAEIVGVALSIGYYGGMLLPIQSVEQLYDLEDSTSLLTWALSGQDVWGEEMSTLDAALTVGGFFLPQVVETVVEKLARAAKRLRTIGDDPFARLVYADGALTAGDKAIIVALTPPPGSQ